MLCQQVMGRHPAAEQGCVVFKPAGQIGAGLNAGSPHLVLISKAGRLPRSCLEKDRERPPLSTGSGRGDLVAIPQALQCDQLIKVDIKSRLIGGKGLLLE